MTHGGPSQAKAGTGRHWQVPHFSGLPRHPVNGLAQPPTPLCPQLWLALTSAPNPNSLGRASCEKGGNAAEMGEACERWDRGNNLSIHLASRRGEARSRENSMLWPGVKEMRLERGGSELGEEEGAGLGQLDPKFPLSHSAVFLLNAPILPKYTLTLHSTYLEGSQVTSASPTLKP